MNLIEAVKSGKRFRRQHRAIAPDGGWIREGYCFSVNAEDVLADDWECEEPKKRLYAFTRPSPDDEGLLIAVFFPTEIPRVSYTRAPWLDQPE